MWVLLWPLTKESFCGLWEPYDIFFLSVIWFRTNLQNTTLRENPGASNIWGPSNTCGPTNFCAGPSNNSFLSNTHSASNTCFPINTWGCPSNNSFLSNTWGASNKWVRNTCRRVVAKSCQHRTNDLLTRSSKTNYERTTGELTICLTIDDCLNMTIDGSKRTKYWLRVFIANQNITAYKFTDHVG